MVLCMRCESYETWEDGHGGGPGDEEAHRFGAHTVEKKEPHGVGEEIAVLLKRQQLDP